MHEISLIEDQKADFNDIYVQPDPRAYFSTLSRLDYQIPQQARPVFDTVLDAMPGNTAPGGGGPRDTTVVDLCCSYGVNAALLRHDLDLTDLNRHYTELESVTLSPGELLDADRQYFAEPARHPGVDVIGLDAAQPAIDYAVGAGLLADGWAENLERDDPSQQLVEGVSDAGVIISTGGVGYVGRPTFERLLSAIDDPQQLWLAIFVLRVFDYDDISDLLGDYGLVTEQVPDRTYPQRRFADAGEQTAAIHDVQRRGLDPDGKESAGWFHANCFLSRPAAAAAQTPVAELFDGVR
jgi:hypothetical protein